MIFRYKPGRHDLKKVLAAAYKDCEKRMLKATNNPAAAIFGKIKWPIDPVQFQKQMRDDRETPTI